MKSCKNAPKGGPDLLSAVKAASSSTTSSQASITPKTPQIGPIDPSAFMTKVNEILGYIQVQDKKIRVLEDRVAQLEQSIPRTARKMPNDADFLLLVRKAYQGIGRKVADKVSVADVIEFIQREINLPDDAIYDKLVECFYNNAIDLQLGKDPARAPQDDRGAAGRRFTWLGLK
ncbi:MAG: hypothetical protein Q6373_008195 [Candidatus Sigynarchaeota archaeon]